MKRKNIFTIAGIAGALAITLSGCSLSGIGGGTLENDIKEESREAKIETSIAEGSNETVPEADDSKNEAEKPVTEDTKEAASPVIDDTKELAVQLEELQAEADRITQAEQARADESARQQEEYNRQQEEYNRQQEEYRRQIEAQKEENRKRIEQYNAEVAAQNEANRKKLEQYNAEVEAYNKRMSNYYYNPNHTELINDVNINPGYIIYDSNGNLYATCYVSNGKNCAVYDIIADYIELYDGNGNIIARDENVQIGYGGSLGGHSYSSWTFVFSGDKVKQSSADLTNSILCRFGVGYRF